MTSPRRFVFLAAAGLVLGACGDESPTSPNGRPSYSRAEPEYEFASIDLAGATATNPQGINAAGHIVGAYVQGGVTRGFLLKDGVAETIVVEGAGFTFARGIGPDGTIVGNWRPLGVNNGVVSLGFKRTSDGQITTVGFAGKKHVIPQRILPNGTILGCAHDDDLMDSMVGATMNTTSDAAVSIFASMHNGGTPDGRHIVGLYANMDAGRGEGYLISDGQVTPLLVPGSLFTAAWDMNARGDVAGVYVSADNRFHGFVLTEAGYTTLDFPGAAATRAFGINARGDVVGHYVLGGVTRGFLARRIR